MMLSSDAEARRRTLYARPGFRQLPESPVMPEVTALTRWLGTWSGIGHIAGAFLSAATH